MKKIFTLFLILIFSISISLFSQEYYQSKPEDVPDWAKPGAFRFLRIDGGPMEVEKAKLSSWGLHFSNDDNEVMGKIFDRYSDDMLYFLKKANFDWVWVTYSNGFSMKEETINRAVCESFLKKCHKNGIKVSAYFSMTNMFWVNMFVDDPQSVKWLNFVNGKPQVYGRSNIYRFQCDINQRGWRDYLLKKIELALEAGFDGIFFDNLQADIEGIKSFLTEVQELAEKYRTNGFKPLVYVNAHLPLNRLVINDVCDKVWNEFAHSAIVTGDREWSVDNVRKTKYIIASSPLWKPHCTDMTRYLNGSREEVVPLPKEQKLGIAEARAFGSAMGKNFEGPCMRALIKREREALDSWDAVSTYNGFTKKNTDYYLDVESSAKVAVIAPFDPVDSQRKNSFDFKLQSMLIKKSILIDVVPVNRIESIERIKDYKLIILTGADGLDRNLRNILRKFLDSGGKVLSVRDVPSLNGDGFMYIENSEKDNIMRDGFDYGFIDKVNSLTGKPQIIIEGAEYVLGNVMIKTNGSKMFVHIVNYSDNTVENIKLKIFIDIQGFERRFNAVKCDSPDDAEFDVLQNDKDYIEIDINNLDTYGVVVIQ